MWLFDQRCFHQLVIFWRYKHSFCSRHLWDSKPQSISCLTPMSFFDAELRTLENVPLVSLVKWRRNTEQKLSRTTNVCDSTYKLSRGRSGANHRKVSSNEPRINQKNASVNSYEQANNCCKCSGWPKIRGDIVDRRAEIYAFLKLGNGEDPRGQVGECFRCWVQANLTETGFLG